MRFKIATPGIPPGLCFQIAIGALTADGVLEVGALGGVVGELDPAEPPESLLAPGRVVTLLQEEEFEGVGLLQPGDLQLRLVGAALALHLGAPRQRDVGLLRDQL